MLKTLFTVLLWALAGWGLGSWLGAHIGWGLFSLGLLLMIFVSGMQVSRISRWANDIESAPPVSVGPWDDILSMVYRKLRRDRQAIDHLEQTKLQMLEAAHALPDGAVTLDGQMQLTWCNRSACEHLGLNPGTDIGYSIFNILRMPEFARYARQGRWADPVQLHLQNEEHDRTLLLQLVDYGVDRYLMVTRDITQLEKLETTRKDFVANVSHELRTPLTVLTGFLETLQDMPPDSLTSEQRLRYVGLMREQAGRMEAIVSDLLTLSTLESSPVAEAEPVDMSALVHKALQQGRILSRDQHVFVVHCDESLQVEGVDSELTSAISNLITNAVRYTPKDGTITVSWYRADDGTAVYTVQDTGIGIAPQDIPRLTERFYRADRGRSRSTGGTGLGLAITKHVAMRHEAELRIQSRYGSGSTFSLVFPQRRIVSAPAVE
ncbi:phosphate regulon sensor histidine kinase PhoR [Alcaligenaceae bacterium]|nr:phosphate regulon sensor histidine kinase PhoR [Alcaligenaceae bacterium]